MPQPEPEPETAPQRQSTAQPDGHGQNSSNHRHPRDQGLGARARAARPGQARAEDQGRLEKRQTALPGSSVDQQLTSRSASNLHCPPRLPSSAATERLASTLPPLDLLRPRGSFALAPSHPANHRCLVEAEHSYLALPWPLPCLLFALLCRPLLLGPSFSGSRSPLRLCRPSLCFLTSHLSSHRCAVSRSLAFSPPLPRPGRLNRSFLLRFCSTKLNPISIISSSIAHSN